MKKNITRGFITIATGDDWYYKIAVNLLMSYRYMTKKPLPFAIIADRKNEMTEQFDKVIILDNATRSYNDKLRLVEFLPFDETIFIDADCLAYDDLNILFEVFKNADDFCCFGKTLPLTEKFDGWFSLLTFPEITTSNSGVIDRETAKKYFSHTINMHGGLYFIRNTEVAKKVFKDARACAENYEYYKFKVFDKPADEPVLALAMAMNYCEPISFNNYALSTFWRNPTIKLMMSKKRAVCKGENISLVHWGTLATKTAIYKKQVDQLYMNINRTKGLKKFWVNLANTKNCVLYYTKQFLHKLKNKILG